MPIAVILPASLSSRTVTPASSRPLKLCAFHSSHVRPSLLARAMKARRLYMVLAVPIQILTRSRPTIGLTKLDFGQFLNGRRGSKLGGFTDQSDPPLCL